MPNQRSASRLVSDRPRKRERLAPSNAARTPSVGTSSRHQTSRQNSVSARARFAGDGLDYRRPVTSGGSRSNPIDLSGTDEDYQAIDDEVMIFAPPSRPTSRPPQQQGQSRHQPSRGPRFSRDIFNYENSGTNNGFEAQIAQHAAAVHPEPQSYAQLPPLRSMLSPFGDGSSQRGRRLSLPRRQLPQSDIPPDADVLVIDDDDADDEGGISFVGGHDVTRRAGLDGVDAQMRRNWASGRPMLAGIGNQPHNLSRSRNVISRLRQMQHRHSQEHLHQRDQASPRPGGAARVFGLPMMDYVEAGWNLFANRPAAPARQPTPPVVHEPLPPVPTGFTRSPVEGEVLVCPKCERELCSEEARPESPSDKRKSSTSPKAAKDTVFQEEIWIIKACGHVYCGICAHHRPKSISKKPKTSPKGKQKETTPAPFTHCVVDGCGEKAAGKTSMIQLFL